MIADKLRKSILQSAIQGKLTEQLLADGDTQDLLKDLEKEKSCLLKAGMIKTIKSLEVVDEEIPFEIPSNWSWVRLGDISRRITAGGDKPIVFSLFKTKDLNIPVIANGKINDGVLGYTNRATVFEPSITISARGTIGYSCVRTEPFFPIVRLLTIIPLSSINLVYLKYVLTSLLEIGVGTSIQQLTIPMIFPKLIPLPPIAEQLRIVQKIEKIMPEIDKLEFDETKLEHLQKDFPNKIRNSILNHAFQGKLTEQLSDDGDAYLELIEIIKNKVLFGK